MSNKFLDLRKKILKPKFLEKFLFRIIWLFTFFSIFHVIRNSLYLMKIKPNMLEMELMPLMFFFQVYYFNIILMCICVGFLLLYYQYRIKRIKNNIKLKGG